MIEFLGLIAAAWFCRRVLVWMLLRAAAFAIGFVLGWRLLDRR